MNTRQLASLFQFRDRTLLIAVAFVGLAITALMNATPAWSHDLYFAVVLLLTLAIPLALYRSGERRAFWAGFALFGWVYLVLIGNIDDRPRTEWNNANAVSRGPSANIPTSRLTYWAYKRAYGAESPDEKAPSNTELALEALALRQRRIDLTTGLILTDLSGSVSADSGGSGASGSASRPRPEWWHFLNVGHALWTIVVATIGGIVVRGIYILRPTEQGERGASAP